MEDENPRILLKLKDDSPKKMLTKSRLSLQRASSLNIVY